MQGEPANRAVATESGGVDSPSIPQISHLLEENPGPIWSDGYGKSTLIREFINQDCRVLADDLSYNEAKDCYHQTEHFDPSLLFCLIDSGYSRFFFV